jgi:hypothetical protein
MARAANATKPPARRRAAPARAAATAHPRSRAAASSATAAPAPARSRAAASRATAAPARPRSAPAPRTRLAIVRRGGRVARPAAAGVLDRLVRGPGWIVAIGVLLAGVVFFNVSVLELNRGITRDSQRAAELRRVNSELRVRVAKLGSSERIQRAAAARGFVLPAPGEVRYVRADPARDPLLAAQRIEPPGEAGEGATAPPAANTPAGAAPAPGAQVPPTGAPPPAATPQSAQPPQATPPPQSPTAQPAPTPAPQASPQAAPHSHPPGTPGAAG